VTEHSTKAQLPPRWLIRLASGPEWLNLQAHPDVTVDLG
jgi:hypothetical protein